MARFRAKPTTRITIGFSQAQMVWLQREADRRGIPVSEVIRRVVDEIRGDFFIEPRNEAA